MLYFICFFSFFIYLALSFRNRAFVTNLKITESKKGLLSLFIIICLVIITSIRWGTGSDFYSYLELYNHTPDLSNLNNFLKGYGHIELGYKVLIAFTRIFNSELFFYFFNALLSIGIMYVGLLRLNKVQNFNLVFALFLFFLVYLINYPFNAMRQAITMAIFIYTIKDIYEHNSKKVLIISLVSVFIHSTGALIFISYLWYRVLRRFSNIYTFIGITLLSFIFYHFGLLTLIVSIFFPAKVEVFTEFWGAVSFSSLLYRYLIIAVVFSLYIQYKSVKLAELLIIIYLLGLLFYTGLSSSDMLAARFNMFFRVLEVIILSIYISNIPTRLNRYIYFLVTTLIMTLPFLAAIDVDENEYKLNPIFHIN